MRHLLTILAALFVCAPAFGQVKQQAYYSNNIPNVGGLVHLRAVNYGPSGNSIVLSNTQQETLAQEISAWNAANPSNQVTFVSGNPGDLQLGTNQYTFALSNGFINTVKALSYITNTGEVIADTGGNALRFTDQISLESGDYILIGNQIQIDPGSLEIFKGGANVFNIINDRDIELGGSIFMYGDRIEGENYFGFLDWSSSSIGEGTNTVFHWQYDGTNGLFLNYPLSFIGTNAAASAAATRTNLGLGWSALTNSNAATALLGYATNGQVVANTGTNVLTFTNETVTVNNLNVGALYQGTNLVYELDSGQFAKAIRVEEAYVGETRTNLGLGGGITTNRTFVAGGVTNSVTISNGIITGWTQ